ncbi:hypothetical protein V8F33_004503 [Rhypophila sp. PSN 637]
MHASMYTSRPVVVQGTMPVPLDTWSIRCSCISALERTFGVFARFLSGIVSMAGKSFLCSTPPLFELCRSIRGLDLSSLALSSEPFVEFSEWPPPGGLSCSPTEEQLGLLRSILPPHQPRSAYTDAFTQQRPHVPYHHCQVSDRTMARGRWSRRRMRQQEGKKKLLASAMRYSRISCPGPYAMTCLSRMHTGWSLERRSFPPETMHPTHVWLWS